MGTDEHGNAGDGINDNGDNIALESTSSSTTQRIEQPRMNTDRHGNAGDGTNDNTDNIALESTSSSATQE